MRQGFDNDKYNALQTEKILERINEFGGKLYLEFGGKLFDDYHASRVLPGFAPDSKINMLMQLKDQAEIVIVVSAAAIEQNKMRADLGITYDMDALRLMDAFRERGLYVGSVVITQYSGQPAADLFIKRLNNLGIRVFKHYIIPGYPTNTKLILSPDGYGRNEYIETERQLVVVTAPGPGSGKMATCLSQLYQDSIRGQKSGYAKYETFPIWNLALTHPVNIAYEAATVDLSDVNMIDPFHLEAYGTTTVNYNRDVEIFPVLRALFDGIYGTCPYKSPTDMGVNMAGYCIYDDEAVSEAARMEIVRRYYDCLVKKAKGKTGSEDIYKMELIMNRAGISISARKPVQAALDKAAQTDGPSAAIELPDGTLVTGKTSELMGASAAALLNALKVLAGIDDDIHLISPVILEPICKLKTENLGSHNPRLHADEILIALSISAASEENARRAFACLPQLAGCEAHSSVIVSHVDQETYRKLGIHLTCEPVYGTKKLYHR
ncbi:MAG: DUF1846 domain-containing protein [Ruminococcaceae bacterium]|nr:DUF1846 domain-containing protein [Oscillospiraceae bacterium]